MKFRSDLVEILQDAAARSVAAREALADGHIDYAEAVLERQEIDLAAAIDRLRPQLRAVA